ncbi:hypothetical protein MAR_022619 [Mya arenaria]|uniref:Uncharacterized protein n=1 Tax=Mya arenaria TaxID=6604 RepID=A0ABY7DMR8_MYAAR|nr:hypothetical protein MAR_022619 [Mya arenaria]
MTTISDKDTAVRTSVRQKLLAPPSLSPADFPCYPGALVIQRESTMQTTLLRRPRKAFIVGMVYDFIPPGINRSPQFRTDTRQCNPGKHCCVFRGRMTDRSAIITASGLHWIELNMAAHGSRETRDVLETTDLRIYMGNFGVFMLVIF